MPAQQAQLAEAPSVRGSEHAKTDTPPSRATPHGAVAHARQPGAASRAEMAAAIRDQDDLVRGAFGAVYYKPATVGGVELKLEPVQPSIGTVVHGIDLATDLEAPGMVSFLRQLWLQRRVLMFRGQDHLSREQMATFAECFGEIGVAYGERGHEPNAADLSRQITVRDARQMLLLPADQASPGVASGWHADATWQQRPPMASVLMCREAPPVGGDTSFCDCYAMWEGLPEEVKARVEHLTAEHVGNAIHRMDGKTPVSEHPVARTHPETGGTTLYVQQGFVRRFHPRHAVPEEEERRLLWRMKLQEGRPEYTCRFRWEAGSMVLWDNRAALHCASGDFWPHSRKMERLTILDRDLSRRTPYYAPGSKAGEAA